MQDADDPHGPRSAASSPALSSRRRRRPAGGPAGKVAGVVVLLTLAGGIGWWVFRSGDDADPPVAVTPEATQPATPATLPTAPPLELPELSASDAFIREVVSRLSSHPQLAAWLVPDDLVYRFVGAVVDLAGNFTPAEHVRHLTPNEGFSTQQSEGRTVIADASFRRFDLLAATAASLDTQGTAELYVQLLPLMEEAYAELGIPDFTFSETVRLAVNNLLAVQVPNGPFEVTGEESVYIFVDPALEDRRGLEKQLIRMGPQNARLLQQAVRELAAALGIAA